MGSGCYSYLSASARATETRTTFATNKATYGETYARQQIFTQQCIDPEMDIRGKIRECLDSDEHPNTVPVIIALDVTGSMGSIPSYLIQEAFPEIMKKIQDEGIKDVQVCFMGVGDHYYDDAPIQVGQFESSDDLMEKWLTKLWLEGGGGPNAGESYLLAWYAAIHHTSCDALLKGRKGILITIGDEPNLKSVDDSTIRNLFGSTLPQSAIASDLLNQVQAKGWEVYHINVTDWSGNRTTTKEYWNDLMGSHCIHTQDEDGRDIVGIIAGIISGACKGTPTPVTGTTDNDVINPDDIL